MSKLFDELKRRNVFRVAVLYVVTAWLVLQVADVVIPYFGIPDWAFRLVLVLFALGFLPALVFSWAYEITPEGIKRESEVDRSQSITPVTAQRIDRLIVGLLVVLIGLVVVDRFLPRVATAPESEPAVEGMAGDGASKQADDPTVATAVGDEDLADPNSIAVLPFVNMSSDPQQEFFSDGLAESLLHLLAQVQELRVAARTSSFQFKGHTGQIADIGRTLNVANVLEGSVQRAGEKIRVTAQLIKVEDGFHLWSGTYDRTLDDVFAIQDEIARHVAESLKVALLGEGEETPHAASTSIEAYDQYLLGRHQLAINSYESLPRAIEHLQRVVELDPDYAPAWVALAETWYDMGNTGLIGRQEQVDRVREAASRALAIDLDNAQARALLANSDFVQHFPAGSGVAELEYRRALELAPRDAFVLGEYARYIGYNRGDPLPVLEKALRIDPLSSNLMSRMALTAPRYGEFDLAIRWGERLQTLYPENPTASWALTQAYWRKGDVETAVRYGRRMLDDDPSDYEGPASLAGILLDLDLVARARTLVAVAEQMGPGRPMPAYARMALAYRSGEKDQAGELALNALEAGIDGRHWGPEVMFAIGADHALRTGGHDRYLSAMSTWTEIDAMNASVDNLADYWDKVTALKVVRASGRDALADEIRSNARRFLTEMGPKLSSGLSRLELELDAGDRAAAAAEYERLIDKGDYRFWWLYLEPRIQPIVDDPRVSSVRQKMLDDLARMRTAVEAFLAENPVPLPEPEGTN